MRQVLLCAAAIVLHQVSASAQQRPLVTEDPETIGAGRVLVEAGVDWGRNATYPASGPLPRRPARHHDHRRRVQRIRLS
jgi:hypothetical protein